MTNRYIRNKEIIKHAPNYYKIMNENISHSDLASPKIIEIYSEYIFSIRVLNENGIKKIERIDKLINKYFDDIDFKKEFSKGIMNIKVRKDEENVLEYIVECLFQIYDKYLESYTRNIYIPRWI